MASVRKLVLPTGEELYSPGGKVAIDVGLSNETEFDSSDLLLKATLDENATHLNLTIGYMRDVIKPEGYINWEFTELSTASLNKTTGEVIESDAEKILEIFENGCQFDVETTVKILTFAANAAFINNPYAYKAIKETDMLNHHTLSYNKWKKRTPFLYWMMIHELDFFEKLLKTSKDILMFNIDTMNVQEFLSKYKDNAIPSGVVAKINELSTNYYVLRNDTKNDIIKIVQHITQTEDGNNAKLFIDWLDGWLKLEGSINSSSYRSGINGFMDRMYALLTVHGYNSKHLIDYLTRQSYFYGSFSFPSNEIVELYDYLKIGKDSEVKTEPFPSHVRKAHNCLVSNRRAFADISLEKSKAFTEACAESAAKYATKMGDYVVVFPKEPKDLFVEGTTLNHCVGGYVNPVIQRQSIVAFLRKKDAPDTPLYTIEIKDGTIIQAKGNYNADVPSDIAVLLQQIEKRWSLRAVKALKKGEEEDA